MSKPPALPEENDKGWAPEPEGVSCYKCGSPTVIEFARGWWCTNIKCSLSKKKRHTRKADLYRPDDGAKPVPKKPAMSKLTINDLKPSHFTGKPFGSILQNSESETIALNSMVIRKRLGDKWDLSWKEYKAERKKDNGFTEGEKTYFEKVIPLISDVIGAISFSQSWARAAREATK